MEISISQITWRIMIIVLLALFGVAARRFKLIKEEACSSFTDVMINLTLPSLIFVTLTTEIKWGRLVEGVFTPLIAIILILIILLIAYFSRRFIQMSTDRFRTFLVLCAMPNTGFIGFPVVFSVLGNEGLAYAVLFDLGANIAFFSIIIAILKDGSILRTNWRTMISPPLIAVLLGLAVNRLGINLPTQIIEPLRIMGDATVPIAMLLMGYFLAGLKFRVTQISLELGIVSLIKLVLYPTLAYLLLRSLTIDPIVKAVIIIESAMPSMASTPVLIQKYGGDEEIAALTVLVTTLLSIVSIPLLLHFLG